MLIFYRGIFCGVYTLCLMYFNAYVIILMLICPQGKLRSVKHINIRSIKSEKMSTSVLYDVH